METILARQPPWTRLQGVPIHRPTPRPILGPAFSEARRVVKGVYMMTILARQPFLTSL